jgi:uncharacterized membrane protein YkoI
MLKAQLKALCATGILSVSLVANAAPAEVEGAVVPLKEVPTAAQKAIQAQLGDGRLNEITRSIEDGVAIYDVEIIKDSRTRDFTVNAAGDLLEEQVFSAELPLAVRRAIHAHVGKAVLGEIYKVFDAGEVTYNVTMTKGNQERDFTLSETGKLLEIQVFLDELPAAVRKAVQQAIGSAPCGDIYKSTEDGEVFYDVDVETGGKTRTLTFDATGTPVSEAQEVALVETPVAVQKTLTAQLAGAKLASLQRVVEDGTVTYSADLVKAGKRVSLTLNPAGAILPPENN